MQPDEMRTAVARDHMVRTQIEARGIADPRVLESLRTVPRHRFVPADFQVQAHEDHPLPIGHGQTISQPYIVALMAEELHLETHDRVLEIGSGCGYMAAVLSRLAQTVYAIELEPELAKRSRHILTDLGYGNIQIRCGDGAEGWPEHAPFDGILLSCAADAVPPPLWPQLAEGGRIIAPLGTPYGHQELVCLTKTRDGAETRSLGAVAFVPLR